MNTDMIRRRTLELRNSLNRWEGEASAMLVQGNKNIATAEKRRSNAKDDIARTKCEIERITCSANYEWLASVAQQSYLLRQQLLSIAVCYNQIAKYRVPKPKWPQ